MLIMSAPNRRRLVEQTLLAGLGMSPDDLISEKETEPTITFESYARAVQGAFSRSFEEDEYVFRRGDLADAAYLIKKGRWRR